MALIRKAGSKLTLHIDGPRIDSARFRHAVDAFLGLIEEVTRQVEGGSRTVTWLISVKGGSVHLSAAPEAQRPTARVREITSAIRAGVSLIQRRAERPKYFSDQALRQVRELAITADGKDVETTQITLARKRFRLTTKAAANVDALLESYVKDYGTVEGRLMVVSAQGGLSIAVVDPLTDRAVRCFVTEEQLDEAIKYFRKRVAVSGMIHYRKDGQLNSIEVDDLTPFEEVTLPSAEDVHGILSKLQ